MCDDKNAPVAAQAQPDPCPQCVPGGVCKTPKCGRLLAAQAKPTTPRYDTWRHLREHGTWPDGIPDWARDHFGHMDDSVAARSVIEELAAVAQASGQDAEDAARYRWLRTGAGSVWCGSGDDLLTGEELDAAIDAARRAAGGDHDGR